jgi:hypothetical protein
VVITKDRFRGSLLAGAIGDALGAKTEFDSIDRIREIAGPAGITDFIPAYGGVGKITDDTQMTLFTLEALIRAHAQQRRSGTGKVEQSLQMAYQRWLHTQGIPWERARGPKDDSAEADGWLVTNLELYSRRPRPDLLQRTRGVRQDRRPRGRRPAGEQLEGLRRGDASRADRAVVGRPSHGVHPRRGERRTDTRSSQRLPGVGHVRGDRAAAAAGVAAP